MFLKRELNAPTYKKVRSGPRRVTEQPAGRGTSNTSCSGPPQDSHGDATERPERPERPPRLPEEAPKRTSGGQDGPRCPKISHDGPKTAQDAAKTAQEASNGPPKRAPRSKNPVS
eukprot:9045133-Pyramimonas_sp.AAC.1